MKLTTVGFHHMACGCLPDDGYGLKACPTHILAPKLKDAAQLVRLKPEDPDALEFLNAVLDRIDILERDERPGTESTD